MRMAALPARRELVHRKVRLTLETDFANVSSIVSSSAQRPQDGSWEVLVDEEPGHSTRRANFFVAEGLGCVADRREHVFSG